MGRCGVGRGDVNYRLRQVVTPARVLWQGPLSKKAQGDS